MCRFIGLDVLTRRSWGFILASVSGSRVFEGKNCWYHSRLVRGPGFFGDRLLRLSLFSICTVCVCVRD
jgi:hypothetical protein